MPNRLPEWLKKRIPSGAHITEGILEKFGLHTVCVSAHCPNRGECFSRSEAAFMILGNVCTRDCRFCAVKKGMPLPVDTGEPSRISAAAAAMGLKYVVITSVTRDDLEDGGASQFAEVVKELRKKFSGSIGIELLVPDFCGDRDALRLILSRDVTVLNHNLETVRRLYPAVRRQADYSRSLELLKTAKKERPGIITKSGLMLGLGEAFGEVAEAMQALRKSGCDFLTLGQYLRPGPGQIEVAEFITPGTFKRYEAEAYRMGFAAVASGPFVRSSYNALFMHKGAEKCLNSARN